MKKNIVIMFFLIFFIPYILGIISILFNISCDIQLNGYFERVINPKLNFESFWNGHFQVDYSKWFEQELKPRGIFIRTYASIQYYCFNLGNKPIGKNKDIFEDSYIFSELCIGNYPNYIEINNRKEMESFIAKLEILQKKLNSINKKLLICISPSKANFDLENIPEKFFGIAPKKRINAAECFSELIAKTNVPCIICRDLKNNLQYPAFYPTGIHWSRTFEQQVSAMIIEKMSHLTGKNYRNMVLGEPIKKDIPFWRDADIYSLQNIWKSPKGTYYEFFEQPGKVLGKDNFGLLMQGTSFSAGILNEIQKIYPYSNVYSIGRNNSYSENYGAYNSFKNFSEIDFTRYLNNVDVVLIEMTECECHNQTYGFVDFLIDFLDQYIPQKSKVSFANSISTEKNESINKSSIITGVYNDLWMKKESEIIIEDSMIQQNGLLFKIEISNFLFMKEQEPVRINIFVNDYEVYWEDFSSAEQLKITIPPEMLYNGYKDKYYIKITASRSFIPQELNINNDSRELAFQILYIGGVK